MAAHTPAWTEKNLDTLALKRTSKPLRIRDNSFSIIGSSKCQLLKRNTQSRNVMHMRI